MSHVTLAPSPHAPRPLAGEPTAAEELDELLDLDRHKLSVIPKKEPTPGERWMKYFGLPGGLLIFALLVSVPTPTGLTGAGQAVLALFSMCLVWWVTEPIATHVTSLILIAGLVLMNAWEQDKVLAVLGLDVIWLNITAFILSSILVKTNLARRLALTMFVAFGGSAVQTFGAFLGVQLVLAAFIPATAARAVMTLPLMMVAAAIYGSTAGQPTNFGRNLFLLNLLGINIFSSAFMTGSAANLNAVTFMESMGGEKIYYTTWLLGGLPVALITMLAAWWLGPGWLFPLAEKDRTPHIQGGIDALRRQRDRMGPMSFAEKKAAVLFGFVLILWTTDQFHLSLFGFEIEAVIAALLGAIITFLPGVGLLQWNEADIPWHLMIFSAGAYAGGMALDQSGAARWAIEGVLGFFHITRETPFWALYAGAMALMIYSHLFFTSKTMRTMIIIPFVILTAKTLGYKASSLALPAAFTIDWVVGLPISAKPNVILYTTGQYSVVDNLKFGVLVCTVGYLVLLLAGATWFRFLGIIP
ncbi:MAG: sodium:sulfate symporter [Candidatus Riflebacteria bacterium]|nr:sodium:sulfate symporter [Candidatus Riflebacteria bacterium]